MVMFECQKCGASIAVCDPEPGRDFVCERCEYINVVSLPVPTSTATRLLAHLVNIVWYFGLTLLIATLAIMIILGNKNFWYGMGFEQSVPIPVEVVLERPHRAAMGFLSKNAGYQQVLLQGYERPSVNRMMPLNPTYWYTLILVWASIILWIINEVRLLVTSVRCGWPFSPRNPNRIRRIALAVFIYIALTNLSNIWIYRSYSEYITIDGARIAGPIISYYPELIVLGVTLFIIAHVFDWGRRLQSEYDHTV